MKRWAVAIAVAASLALVAGLYALPAFAGRSTSAPVATPATAQSGELATVKVLPQRLAEKAADVALADCAKRGFPVSVTVLDPDGVVIVTVRADGATGATVEVSKGKAAAAAGFKSPTSGLQDAAKTQPGFVSLPGFVILPGGLPVFSGSTLVAGIGVSGAPSGDIDAACATTGLKAIGFAS
jgi:uncharacterized protein GlcG (DUF336 family)